jgi:opacity protein-like surface antigen
MRILSTLPTGALALSLYLGLFGAVAIAQPYARIDVGASAPNRFSGDYFAGTGLGGRIATQPVLDIGLGYEVPFQDFTLRGEIVAATHAELRLVSGAALGAAYLDARSTLRQYSGLANIYLDVKGPFGLKPFVGMGAGVARNELGAVTSALNGVAIANEAARSQTTFAWNAMAGLAFDLTSSVTLDLTYRHLNAGRFQSSGRDAVLGNVQAVKSDFSTNQGLIGVRVRF